VSPPEGHRLTGDRLRELLGLEPATAPVVGEGRAWQAARVVLVDLDLDDCKSSAEPHELFNQRLGALLRSAGTTLTGLAAPLGELRRAGFRTDILVDSWITENQLDLELPVQFLAAAATLALPLALTTND
jgi:hypothetical protein